MIRRPPRATRTYTLFPYTTLFRSRAELLGKAREFTLFTATSARQRLTVPDVSFAIPPEINVASLGEIVKTDANASIEALRANAAIDREEIDLLWWVVADWSELLGRRFSPAENPAAPAVASGLEAGRMLRRIPADAHRHPVLRHVCKTDPLNLDRQSTRLNSSH